MMASFMCQSVRLQYSVINLNTNLDVALKVSCGCDQQHHQLTLSKGNWPHNVGGFHIKTLRAKLEASQKRENSVWRLWHQFPPKFSAYQPTHNHLTQFFFSISSFSLCFKISQSRSLSLSQLVLVLENLKDTVRYVHSEVVYHSLVRELHRKNF